MSGADREPPRAAAAMSAEFRRGTQKRPLDALPRAG